jgi:hypothetical protein
MPQFELFSIWVCGDVQRVQWVGLYDALMNLHPHLFHPLGKKIERSASTEKIPLIPFRKDIFIVVTNKRTRP